MCYIFTKYYCTKIAKLIWCAVEPTCICFIKNITNNTNPTKISRGLEGWRSSPDFVNEFNVIIRTLFLMEKYFPEFPGSAENYASKGIRNNGRCFFLQYSRNTQTLQFSRITLLKLFTSFAIGHMDICISHLMPLVSFHNP